MQALLPWIAVAIVILTGWLIFKRYQTAMVLFMAGMLLILLALLAGVDNIAAKGVKPSGFFLFDIFDTLCKFATKQAAGTGFLIMVAGGFAGYMDKIGAAKSLVTIALKPLHHFSQPYVVLAIGYIIGSMLIAVIPSAAGLAMLLLVALYPILRSVGVSAAAAAAVIGTTGGMTVGPASGNGLLAAKVAGIEPIVYFVSYQMKIWIPTLIVVAICHYFVQKYYDKKNDDQYSEASEIKKDENRQAPLWYAIFPILPIILLVIFSKFGVSSIKLNTNSALLLVWFLAMLTELVRRRNPKEALLDANHAFKVMGKMFSSIVVLIFCAEFFAHGLKVTGLIDGLIMSTQGAGFGFTGMTTVMTGVVGAVTFLTGSGVGAFAAFAALANDISTALGGSTAEFITPMHFASGMFRAMSPVAGVIIAVAGAAGVSPLAIVRRTWIPMCAGMITIMIGVFTLF